MTNQIPLFFEKASRNLLTFINDTKESIENSKSIEEELNYEIHHLMLIGKTRNAGFTDSKLVKIRRNIVRMEYKLHSLEYFNMALSRGGITTTLAKGKGGSKAKVIIFYLPMFGDYCRCVNHCYLNFVQEIKDLDVRTRLCFHNNPEFVKMEKWKFIKNIINNFIPDALYVFKVTKKDGREDKDELLIRIDFANVYTSFVRVGCLADRDREASIDYWLNHIEQNFGDLFSYIKKEYRMKLIEYDIKNIEFSMIRYKGKPYDLLFYSIDMRTFIVKKVDLAFHLHKERIVSSFEEKGEVGGVGGVGGKDEIPYACSSSYVHSSENKTSFQLVIEAVDKLIKKDKLVKASKPNLIPQNKRFCMGCFDETKTFVKVHQTKRQAHGLCDSCIIPYLIKSLQDSLEQKTKFLSIKCCGNVHSQERNACTSSVNLKSGTSISDKLISIIHTDDQLTKLYLELYCKTDSNCAICPNKDCGHFITDIPTAMRNCVCPACSTSWCKNCSESPYHLGSNCSKERLISKICEGEDGEYLRFQFNAGLCKLCPGCYNTVEKNEGCNHITCKCGTHFCWLCEENITNNPYGHFNNPATDCYQKLHT